MTRTTFPPPQLLSHGPAGGLEYFGGTCLPQIDTANPGSAAVVDAAASFRGNADKKARKPTPDQRKKMDAAQARVKDCTNKLLGK